MTATPSRPPMSRRHRRRAPGRPTGRRLPAAAVALLAGALLAGALLVLLAVPATAHPFVRGGGELPVDSLVTMTLDLAHGCGSEASGAGQDTLEVALEIPEWLRVVEVADHPDYAHDREVTQGRISVVTWRAEGAPEPAPVFELDVVASGTVGGTHHLAVFQGCVDSSHRWIGTPEEPADDPAVNVRLVAADPQRPAPPPAPVADPDDEVTEEDPADVVAEDAATEAAAAEPVPSSDQGGSLLRVLTWIGAVLAVVLAAGLLALVLPGRRGADQ